MPTAQQLRRVMPRLGLVKSLVWAPKLTAAMERFGITTPLRQAAFIAQVAHESGELRYTEEIWGPTPTQRRYEGRVELGNVQVGDGYRYRGRAHPDHRPRQLRRVREDDRLRRPRLPRPRQAGRRRLAVRRLVLGLARPQPQGGRGRLPRDHPRDKRRSERPRRARGVLPHGPGRVQGQMILFPFERGGVRNTFVVAPSLSAACRFLRQFGVTDATWTGEAIHE